MDAKKLKQAVDYNDVINIIIKNGECAFDVLKEELKAHISDPSALKRRRDWVTGNPAYITVEDGMVVVHVDELADDIREFISLVMPKEYDFYKDAEKDKEIEDLGKENKELKDRLKEYSDKTAQYEDMIEELKTELASKKDISLRKELERKVLVASSISVGPKVNETDECFLIDPDTLLDVDKCVARYGGELDSFYDEIPTDENNNGFEPGHELTEKNHALYTMKTVGTGRFFKKRIKDNKEVKETEARFGQLFPGHSLKKNERQRERDKILRNRFISLNNIIKADRLTNQEKLMMYAMNSEYHNTHVERLLNYAGNHCINANFLIDILEDPDVCTTYENTVAFLSQFADASEYRMKLNLARELIEGKWYITADYNGHITKFQLVPIEEFNELRKAAGLPVSSFSY
ncbi:MAG: hypothetical protein K6E98_07635, partial [Lachnospiraceae bacterium]|nr:hypothetical protein [Lachnospiraceae bacterium]